MNNDLGPSDMADLADWKDPGHCPVCQGRGYVQHRGEPYACDPCGCDEADEDEDDK